MSNKDNRNISKTAQKIITFFGYWWVSFSVIYGIIQLIVFAFNIKVKFLWEGFIWLTSVLVASSVIAFIFLRVTPGILDRLFRRMPESEKYFDMSKNERSNILEDMICSNAYNLDGLSLLRTLKESSVGVEDTDTLLHAVDIGVCNSPLYNKMKNHFARVINGLYTLIALQKLKNSAKVKEGKYIYTKNYILINDLGWSLSVLNEKEFNIFLQLIGLSHNETEDPLYEHLKSELLFDEILKEELKELKEGITVLKETGSAKDPIKEKAIIHISKAKDDLELRRGNYSLLAQAYRHLINIAPDRFNKKTYLDKLETIIKAIRNKSERNLMWGNYNYLQAFNIVRNVDPGSPEAITELNDADVYINRAKKCFKENSDEEHQIKCINIDGRILLKRGKKGEAIVNFREAYNAALRARRYDHVLINLKHLAQECDGEDSKKYAKRGLDLAKKLGNPREEEKFLNFFKPKQIILLRHGESEKNADNTIGGSGKLTEFGRTTITDRCEQIKRFVESYGYSKEKIMVYGYEKSQINETIDIIKDKIGVDESQYKYVEELKPIGMGVLSDCVETNPTAEQEKMLVYLKQWRNKLIPYSELQSKINSEDPKDFWSRAGDFVNGISDGECAIVVCTTSVAILLIRYLKEFRQGRDNSKCNPAKYYHIDVPLGGLAHFTQSVEEGKEGEYLLVNKDLKYNVEFSKLI